MLDEGLGGAPCALRPAEDAGSRGDVLRSRRSGSAPCTFLTGENLRRVRSAADNLDVRPRADIFELTLGADDSGSDVAGSGQAGEDSSGSKD